MALYLNKQKDGKMIKFNLTQTNLPLLINKLKELNFKKIWKVTISESKSLRSLSQNDRYWIMLKELGDYLGYSDIELHDLLKWKYLSVQKEIAGQSVIVIKSTSSLTTDEFSEYNANIERFANEFGFKFSHDIPQY
jgi:hypothetical protein